MKFKHTNVNKKCKQKSVNIRIEIKHLNKRCKQLNLDILT